MDATFEKRLKRISWSEYRTAYGPAVKVPDQLRRLAGSNRKKALVAAHDLWCGLCHQHVRLSSAAYPAFPFLLEVLDAADDTMAVELLDIMLGFAEGVSRRRSVAFCQAVGMEPQPEARWVTELRAALAAEIPRFRQLAASKHEDIADFASRTVEALTESAS